MDKERVRMERRIAGYPFRAWPLGRPSNDSCTLLLREGSRSWMRKLGACRRRLSYFHLHLSPLASFVASSTRRRKTFVYVLLWLCCKDNISAGRMWLDLAERW